MAEARGPKSRERRLGYRAKERALSPPGRESEERCKLPIGGRGEPRKKLVLVHFGGSIIVNFNDFAFMLGMTVFG